MYPTVQPVVTDFVRASAAVQDALANPVKAVWKGFRSLSKDHQVLLIGLASVFGLLYAIQYVSNKR